MPVLPIVAIVLIGLMLALTISEVVCRKVKSAAEIDDRRETSDEHP